MTAGLTCRVPLQYLNNCCHWREFILAVGPGVLIPRPETELLIDFAQQVRHRSLSPACVAVALQYNTPGAVGLALYLVIWPSDSCVQALSLT